MIVTPLVAALAQEQTTPTGGIMSMLPMLLIMFGIIYFLLIRPQNKERKSHEAMLENLTKNDQVITQGGIIATVAAIEKDQGIISLKIADNVRIKVTRRSIASKIEKKSDTAD